MGKGVSETHIHFGPSYRVYFARRGREVVILLCGGDKAPQARNIAKAQSMVLDL